MGIDCSRSAVMSRDFFFTNVHPIKKPTITQGRGLLKEIVVGVARVRNKRCSLSEKIMVNLRLEEVMIVMIRKASSWKSALHGRKLFK